MPAIGNLTLADGQATPVNHTFTAVKPQNGASSPAEWRDLTKVVKAQQWSLQGSYRGAIGNASRNKVPLIISVPLVRTDTAGVASVVDVASCRIDFTLPDIMTDAERKDLLALAKNLHANAIMTDYVVNQLQQF